MSGQMIGFISALLLVDIVGLHLTRSILFSISSIFLFTIGGLSVHSGINLIIILLNLLTLCAVGGAFGGSQGTWLISPSIFPISLRATGRTLLFAIGRIGAFLSSNVVYSTSDILIVAIIFGIRLMLATIINIYFYFTTLPKSKK